MIITEAIDQFTQQATKCLWRTIPRQKKRSPEHEEDPHYTTVHRLARGLEFFEYGFIDILDRRGDTDILRGIGGLREGSILCIHGGERGGMASPQHGGLTERNDGSVLRLWWGASKGAIGHYGRIPETA